MFLWQWKQMPLGNRKKAFWLYKFRNALYINACWDTQENEITFYKKATDWWEACVSTRGFQGEGGICADFSSNFSRFQALNSALRCRHDIADVDDIACLTVYLTRDGIWQVCFQTTYIAHNFSKTLWDHALIAPETALLSSAYLSWESAVEDWIFYLSTNKPVGNKYALKSQ